MELFHMTDIIPLIGIPYPPSGRSNYNIPCPCCDDNPRKKHLNINLQKDVFRCPRCGFSGGVFDLYAHYAGISRESVREALIARLNVSGDIPKPKPIKVKEVKECPLADVDERHATYSALLSRLPLATDHRENLLSRGLNLEQIERLGYKTTPLVGTGVLAKQLLAEGFYLSGVPGFYRQNGQWTFVSEQRGILIPFRDLEGRIQGLQIRRDNVSKRKFRWVSSIGRPDGCSAECWVHIAGELRPTILLIEGPMKADIVHELTGQTVVAVGGVNALSHLEQALLIFRERGVKKVMAAFDMDFLKNPHVKKGYEDLKTLLTQTGYEYGVYLWNPDYNGLDDYVWKYCLQGGKPSQ